MDNQRLLIWAVFGLMAFWTYEAWMRDYGPKPVPASQTIETPDVAADPTANSLPDLTDAEAPLPAVSDVEPEAVADTATASDPVIRVTTDVLDIAISTRGGTLQLAKIRKYPIAKDNPDEVITLLSTERSDLGMIQTGLRSADKGPEANQNALFKARKMDYTLDEEELVVPLTWTDGQGVTVTKRYRFARGSYRIDVEQTVQNDSDKPWRGAQYAQLHRRLYAADRSMFDTDSYSFDGPVIYDGEKSTKLDRDDLLDDGVFRITAQRGWVATIQHHFLSAVIPPDEAVFDYAVATNRNVATASLFGRARALGCGGANSV